MNTIEDERLRFYLKHQDAIEEWAKLRAEASEVADKFLSSFTKDAADLATSLGPEVTVTSFDLARDPWPKILMQRPSWKAANRNVGVGLGWERARIGFRSPKPVWSGVWVLQENGGSALSSVLMSDFKTSGHLEEGHFDSNRYWPAYRYERPPESPEFWSDLAPYRAQLAKAVREIWSTFSPFIDAAVQRA